MEMPTLPNPGLRSVFPVGVVVDEVQVDSNLISVRAHPAGDFCVCPDCGQPSNRVHSRYERQLLDLPSHGRAVQIRITVRRFRCISRTCLRRIFVERLAHDVAYKSARRTCRLEGIIHHLGIALGGRPAASLAKRLMLPVSKDTLLRVVRRRAIDHTESLRVIGIDDWAWKRGQRYGTIICDLERRRIVELLRDREPGTVAAWLSHQPEIAVIARDRAGGYAQAATRCAPQAIQVADRWHLMENASAAFLRRYGIRCDPSAKLLARR
jgi:transposase